MSVLSFDAALASAWHHPGIAFITTFTLVAMAMRRARFADGFCTVFAFVLAADALVSGAFSPLSSSERLPFEIAFVFLGDARVFLLFERFSPRGLTRATAIRALAVTYAWIPLSTAALIAAGVLREARLRFLYFEAASLLWALALRFVVLPRRFGREGEGGSRPIVFDIALFYAVQYACWAVGDALILSGRSSGKLLRLLGDVLYYGAFLPFAWLRIQDGARRRTAVVSAVAIAVLGVLLSFAGAVGVVGARATAPEVHLTFLDHGAAAGAITRSEMLADFPIELVEGVDPYYGKPKRWRAIPLEALATRALRRDVTALRSQDFVLRAEDGYATQLAGAVLFEGGAHLAIADLDVPAWEAIGPQRANPGPFYLVWSKPSQGELKTHPRPWALTTVEIIDFDQAYPHVRPERAAPDSSAASGFAIFRARCLACHAINGAGGHVGPDLNVPRNVLEYRPEADVRAYIVNPRAFRYGAMPPHPDLSTADLDALIAYLDAKRGEKWDPNVTTPSH